jgi:hypothetical protein
MNDKRAPASGGLPELAGINHNSGLHQGVWGLRRQTP